MTADCITLKEISAYWKRFTSPVVQEEMEQSEHRQLLKSLSQRSFNQYAGDVPSGIWEEGPADFSLPWTCKFDYRKLTKKFISLSNVTYFLPHHCFVEPGHQYLSANVISRSFTAKASKTSFGIFNFKREDLEITNPSWLLRNSIVHIVNSRGCSKCPPWLPLDNYIQMAGAWTVSDFHLDKGNTGAYVRMIECEKLVLLILNRKGLYEIYFEWSLKRFSSSNPKSFWFPDYVPNCTIWVVRVRAGEMLYIPPGCIHFVLTIESSITISGNFFHKDYVHNIAQTWTHEFVAKHPKPCGSKDCFCDPTEDGYNKRVCTLLCRYSALALNGDVDMSANNKQSMARFVSLWYGWQKGHLHFQAFQEHKLESCDCSLPIPMLIHMLYNRKKNYLLPSEGGVFPGWKSPQPITINQGRHFTDAFKAPSAKRPCL